MTPIDTVLYHRHCRDGGTAAWVCSRFGGLQDAKFKSVAYYEDPPWECVDGKHVLIVDFSYKRPVLLEIASRAASVQVLDHHKSAAEELEGLDFCTFDMNRSGAMLAWDWVVENRAQCVEEECYRMHTTGDTAPWPVSYAQDYDLWKHELPDTHLVTAVFQYQKPDDFEAIDRMFEAGLDSCIATGEILHNALVWECQDIVNSARIVETRGVTIGIVNCSPRHWSTALHMLLEQRPEIAFAMAFIGNGKNWTHTLRSRSDSAVDVSRIASVFGGGGHRNASGFKSVNFPIPAESVINAYLFTTAG